MPALLALGFFLYGAGYFLHGLAAFIDTEVFRSWYFAGQSEVAQVQPSLLNQDLNALYMQFQQHMDTLYQLDAVLRSVS